MGTRTRVIDGPIGEVRVVVDAGLVTSITLGVAPERHASMPEGDPRDEAVLDETERQLAEYFAGARRAFDLPLVPRGSAFERATWSALRSVAFGATCSYAHLAAVVGFPRAARAVGRANAHNPWAIVVPCHRVTGKDGALRGYAWGIERKRWLIEHERRNGCSSAA